MGIRGVGRTSKERGEEKAERQGGMECTPQMAPDYPSPALFPRPYLMLWSEELVRAGVRLQSSAHTLEEPQRGLRAADIRSACGFFLWLLHLRLPQGCYFCSCEGFYAGLCCGQYWGPLGLVCSAQSKCPKRLRGHLLSGKWERRRHWLSVSSCHSSWPSTLRKVRWLVGDHTAKSDHRLRIIIQSV